MSVQVMSTRDLFDFVVDISITSENMDAYLQALQQRLVVAVLTRTVRQCLIFHVFVASYRRVETRATEVENNPELAAEQQVADRVFQQVFIPSNLEDVPFLERDLGMAKKGQTDEVSGESCCRKKHFKQEKEGTTKRKAIWRRLIGC